VLLRKASSTGVISGRLLLRRVKATGAEDEDISLIDN
jgi:hypothetical protein